MSELIECAECFAPVIKGDKPVCEGCHGAAVDAAESSGVAVGRREGRDQVVAVIRHADIMDLAQGIRDGDVAKANLALDTIAREFEWGEIVAKGRAAK